MKTTDNLMNNQKYISGNNLIKSINFVGYPLVILLTIIVTIIILGINKSIIINFFPFSIIFIIIIITSNIQIGYYKILFFVIKVTKNFENGYKTKNSSNIIFLNPITRVKKYSNNNNVSSYKSNKKFISKEEFYKKITINANK